MPPTSRPRRSAPARTLPAADPSPRVRLARGPVTRPLAPEAHGAPASVDVVSPASVDVVSPASVDVVSVAVRSGADGPVPGAGTDEVEQAFGIVVADELSLAGATGAVGEVVSVPVSAQGSAVASVRLVGVGDGSALSCRRAGAALARAVRGRMHLAASVPSEGDLELRAFVEGLLLGSYLFRREGAPPGSAPVVEVSVVGGRAVRRTSEALDRAVTTGAAVRRARDLANTPSNEKDPAWLADRAVEVAAASGLSVRVRDERELAAGGFGGIVAVGRGSSRPPRLIELSYEPERAGPRTPHVVLVGKGITFDSGGLSLKPREAMVPMKTDMAAGGVVLATMAVLGELGVTVRVTGLVAAAENMPGADAMRPGDVVTHYGGRTVEVLNTDAEGRLVLADALAYADAELDPDVLVDLATLTGAASLGLGRRHAALYTADDRLATGLLAAGQASGDRLWRMPLVEDYRPVLDSPVADLANVGRDKRVSGGSIVAALFLREFVGRRRWAHLDIAGPARADADEHEVTRGATGYGARLLTRWLESAGSRL